MFPYLDDWLVKGHSKAQVEAHVSLIQSMFSKMGLLLNIPKSTLSLTQRIEFIGATLVLHPVQGTPTSLSLPQYGLHHREPQTLPFYDSTDLLKVSWLYGTRDALAQTSPDLASISVSPKQGQSE